MTPSDEQIKALEQSEYRKQHGNRTVAQVFFDEAKPCLQTAAVRMNMFGFGDWYLKLQDLAERLQEEAESEAKAREV